MAQLTSSNRQDFGHLHLFAQMFAIQRLKSEEGRLRRFFLETPAKAGDFQPRILHVTIRHTDWWSWEDEAALEFEDSWFQALLDTPDLRSTHTLQLELETLDYKVNQLLPIVERLERLESKEFVTHIVDGRTVSTKFVLHGGRQIHNWSGPANINGQEFNPYKGKHRLTYHVITLTWRLRFPELPNAHVPELRRAPRVGLSTSPDNSRNHSMMQRPLSHDTYARQSWFRNGASLPQSGRGQRSKRRKKLNDDALKSAWRDMLDAGLRVRIHSVHQAQAQEWRREKRFAQVMASIKVMKWEERWRDEKSLLHFEGENVVANAH